MSAQVHRAGDSETITVNVRSEDARKIKNRQFYFSIVVSNCGEDPRGFPVEPFIGGERVETFKYPTSGEVVHITGNMPVKIFAKYDRPCALLRGGGYFTGKLKSAPVPIQRQGSNNSFKPKPLRGSA